VTSASAAGTPLPDRPATLPGRRGEAMPSAVD